MKKLFKNSITVVSLIIVSFLAIACSENTNPNIAMITWRGETAAEQGFQDGLKEMGYNATIEHFNAEQNGGKLQRILDDQILPRLNEFDCIYTFGTTNSLAVKTAIKNQVPQIFNIVVDPVEAGLVRSFGYSGSSISGVSNNIPLNFQIANARKVFPVSKLAVLYNQMEENSKITLEKIIDISAELGFEVIAVPTSPDQTELIAALQTITDKKNEADAVYLPADSYIVSQAELIVAELNKAKIKTIGTIEKYLEAGAVVGTVTDYYELGKLAAEIFDRYKKGEKLENISVQKTRNPKMLINKASCDLLGISISDELEKEAEFLK